MRWLWVLIAAVVLLPMAWSLLKLVMGLAFGVAHFVVVLIVILFLVELVRRLMLIR